MWKSRFRGAVEWSLMVAMVLGAGALAQAQHDQAQSEEAPGPVIQIGKADAEGGSPNLPAPDAGVESDGEPAVPNYWIGLVGGPIAADHALRAHLELPEGQGLLVLSVVADGPAAKAGLKANDILLRANDVELRTMHDLVELVITEGEKQGQIAIDVLRRGQRETVYVAPQKRPADAPRAQGDRAFGPDFNLPGGVELPRELLQEFAEGPFVFRNFGPGVVLGGQRLANLPSGVTVSIHKQGDQPARITVERGNESWEVVADDPQSLEQLPADLRPFIERLLHGRTFNVPGQRERLLPELGDGRVRERLERMEQRIQELQERLQRSEASPEQPASEAPQP